MLMACATTATTTGVAPAAQTRTRGAVPRSKLVTALHGPLLDGHQGLYRLAFRHTAISSCSQTFDISTTKGSLTLDLRRMKRASLVVERAVESQGTDRSSGKGYQYTMRVVRCRWSGAARRTPTGLAVDLVREEKAASICSWDGMVSDDKTPKRFTIACKPEEHIVEVARPRGTAAPPTAAARKLPLLSCALGQRVPRALTQATLDGALLLSREYRLHLSRSEGDDAIEDTRTLQLLSD
jgi:hypothetical protein